MNECQECAVIKILSEMLQEHRRDIATDTEAVLNEKLGTYTNVTSDVQSLQRGAGMVKILGYRVYFIDVAVAIALLLSIYNTVLILSILNTIKNFK